MYGNDEKGHGIRQEGVTKEDMKGCGAALHKTGRSNKEGL